MTCFNTEIWLVSGLAKKKLPMWGGGREEKEKERILLIGLPNQVAEERASIG